MAGTVGGAYALRDWPGRRLPAAGGSAALIVLAGVRVRIGGIVGALASAGAADAV